MKVYRWGDLRDIILSELDLEEETFIDPAELINYANKAIDEGEQHLMLIYQDYFRRSAFINWTAGQSQYSLPTDIYSNKIRHMHYINGNMKYRVKRIHAHQIPYVHDNDDFKYDIEHIDSVNNADSGVRLAYYPTPLITGNYMKMWYIRNAARIIDDNTVIDLPESKNFIQAFIAREVAIKEGSPLLQLRESELAKQTQLYKETLDAMVPDDQETIEPDLSFYSDFDNTSQSDY